MKLNSDGTMPEDMLKKLAELTVKKAGNKSNICEGLGIVRSTFYEWSDNFPEFKQAYSDAMESLYDFAEATIIQNIKKGNQRACEFLLTNKRSGEWKTKHQVALSGNISTEVKIDYDDPGLRAEIEELRRAINPDP